MLQIDRIVLCCFSEKDYSKYVDLAPSYFPPQDMFDEYAET